MSHRLFEAIQLGDIALKNRIIMAPMTRGRAGESRMANELIAEYYRQRASAGLIITEATAVSAQGYGWNGAPAIYTDAQAQAWAATVHAVHKAGGRIALQLWHMGRVSHPDFLHGELPVGPSAIRAEGQAHTPSGTHKYVVPRTLNTEELPGIAADYARAAKRAMDVGFDAVEIHAANGYLLDQFLRDGANHRDDDFGGSIENRCRFPLQVVDAVISAVGGGRTGIRVSPRNPYNDMSESDPEGLYSYFAEQLSRRNLAFLHVLEAPSPQHMLYAEGDLVTPVIQAAFGRGKLIANGGYTQATGEDALAQKFADAVAFGFPFISNPDLVQRFRSGAQIVPPDVETLYTPGEKGYTDYPQVAG